MRLVDGVQVGDSASKRGRVDEIEGSQAWLHAGCTASRAPPSWHGVSLVVKRDGTGETDMDDGAS